MIAEVDILPVQFMQRAEDVKIAPIDARVYEESQRGVMRAIFKAQRLMKAEKVPELKLVIKEKIAKLRTIENDLQKALGAFLKT
jgi:hypothetical protein